MKQCTLALSMARMSAMWGPLTSELVDAARGEVEALAQTSPDEPWLAALHHEQPASRELYRDAAGFVLLAHFEKAGLYRSPHDHGRSWVIYAVQQGESEMGAYARIEGDDGSVRLVKRNTTLVKPGQTQVYLPGDIHDTLCVSGPSLLFRLTERDLKVEDAVEKRVTRFVPTIGGWVAPAS